jgi:multiple sugar transport system substrate-binding protein
VRNALELRGITWEHDRGLEPLLATARVYAEVRPNVRIQWKARSLQAFADQAVDALAERFDLVVLDHPSIGFAVARGSLVALDEHLDADLLADQRAGSVGRSFDSYVWDGHLWALAIDAASQVASYRPDLLALLGRDVPRTWEDVFALARDAREAHAYVAIPSIPVDALMSFFSLSVADGADPFSGSRRTRGIALERLAALVRLCHPGSVSWNPPRMYEHMVAAEDVVYCPLGFGYSNYARPGYRDRLLAFAPAPVGAAGTPVGTLGGAGLAVSARTREVEAACAYAAFVASAEIQRGTYAHAGGQPGHRAAWVDDAANAATNDYFRATLPSLDAAYLRPRHDGYLTFQDRAGEVIRRLLTDGGEAVDTLGTLDAINRGTGGV